MAGIRQVEFAGEDMLSAALKARERFLKQHPELQAYQDEIDRTLEKVIGYENRMAVLVFMMEGKLYELRESVAQLQPVATRLAAIAKSGGEAGRNSTHLM